MRDFTERLMFPILPEEAFTGGGITLDEYLERTSTHSDTAALPERQYFAGVWRNDPGEEDNESQITLRLETRADAVFGYIALSENAEEFYELDHISLIGRKLRCTFQVDGQRNSFLELQASIGDEEVNLSLYGMEDYFGNYLLSKSDQE
jgi:choloylglycine hydrolase